MAASVELLAISLASKFFSENGWKVLPVSRLGGEHAGYDLFLAKEDSRLKVEVKGSAKPYRGIPDLYGSEVDDDGRLVADILCVCYFPPGAPEKIAIIRRDDIPFGGLVPKVCYRIKSEHKNPQFIGRKLIDVNIAWHH